MKYVIKMNGKREAFDSKKLYKSVYAACLSVHETKNVADASAKRVAAEVDSWLRPKNEISSVDLRAVTSKCLSKINSHAGYLYKHHRIMW